MSAATMSQPERCDVCHRNFPLTGTTCHPCLTSHQDQDQDQGSSLREAVPGPGGSNEPTELALLVSEWQEGLRTPAEVTFGPMPARAGEIQRNVADHMRLLMGLRIAAGDERPLPYAASMPVKAGLAPDKGTASQAIRALVRMGVVEHVGELPRTRHGIDGTKLYGIPGVTAQVEPRGAAEEPERASDRMPVTGGESGAVPVEAQDIGGPGAPVEPTSEAVDEAGVSDAVRGGPAGHLDWPPAADGGAEGGDGRAVTGHAGERYARRPTVAALLARALEGPASALGGPIPAPASVRPVTLAAWAAAWQADAT